MSQSEYQRKQITDLHSLLTEAGVTTAEVKEDFEGDLYLSIPTEYNEAIEVESFSVRDTDFYFTLTRRAWDRTGGMSAEMEVGESNQPHLMVAMIKADLTHLAEEAAKLEAAMASSDPSE